VTELLDLREPDWDVMLALRDSDMMDRNGLCYGMRAYGPDGMKLSETRCPVQLAGAERRSRGQIGVCMLPDNRHSQESCFLRQLYMGRATLKGICVNEVKRISEYVTE